MTKSGSSELDRPIAIRPTSETVMYPYYAQAGVVWCAAHAPAGCCALGKVVASGVVCMERLSAPRSLLLAAACWFVLLLACAAHLQPARPAAAAASLFADLPSVRCLQT